MTDSLGLRCMERMLDPKLRSGPTAAPPSSATSWYRASKNVTQPVWATKSAFVKMRGLEFTKLNAMFITFPSAPGASLVIRICPRTIKQAKRVQELGDHENCPQPVLLPLVLSLSSPLPTLPRNISLTCFRPSSVMFLLMHFYFMFLLIHFCFMFY